MTTEKLEKFDSSIPRRMYWDNRLKNPALCPECGTELIAEFHAYAIVAEEKGEITTFATGNDGGSFCSQCPVVVLDQKVFAQITETASDITRFQVMGFIDMQDSTDDAIVITEFLSDKVQAIAGDKIGRNDPCPCKSGKKYKKCCMK